MHDGLSALYVELWLDLWRADPPLPGVENTPYWPFVRDYAGNRYDAICRAWSEFTDQACQDLAPERAKKCREIFRACSLHELHFWEMSAHPREDLPTSP